MTIRASAAALLLVSVVLSLDVATPVLADEVTDLVAPYLHALDDHRIGEIAGRALGDPRHPTAPAIPYEGVSVLLLPHSVRFDSELDEIKAHFRDSLGRYMGAAADVESVRDAYESALLWAGGGELIRGEVSDAQGVVRLTGVPAGEWSLLAWREEVLPGKPSRAKLRETKGFREIPMSAGHSVVTYWSTRLQVRAGETTTLEFNDRNVWLSAVRERLFLMEGPPPGAGRRRGY